MTLTVKERNVTETGDTKMAKNKALELYESAMSKGDSGSRPASSGNKALDLYQKAMAKEKTASRLTSPDKETVIPEKRESGQVAEKEPEPSGTGTAPKLYPLKQLEDDRIRDPRIPEAEYRFSDETLTRYAAETDYNAFLNSPEYKAAEKRKLAQYALEQSTDGSLVQNSLTEEEQQILNTASEKKAALDWAKDQERRAKDAQTLQKDMAIINAMSDEERQALKYADPRYWGAMPRKEDWPTGEYTIENTGLVDKYGRKRVIELAETYARVTNLDSAEEMRQKGADAANQHPVASNVGSIPANLIGGIQSGLDYADAALGFGLNTGRYSTLDPNLPGTMLSQWSGAVRETTSENIKEAAGDGALGTALDWGYQGGMSILDNAARLLAAGGSGGASLGLMAVGSFGQTMQSASAAGATPGQAVLQSVASAGLEVLTEKIPLDNLLDMAKGGKTAPRQIVMNILGQAGVEATSEEINYLAGLVAETIIMREKSGYNRQIQELMAQGLDYEAAKAQANQQLWAEAVDTFAVSAISGGGSAAGASAIGAYRTNQMGKFYKGSEQELIQEALELDPDNARAKELRKQLDQKGKVSPLELGTLAMENEAAIAAQQAAAKQQDYIHHAQQKAVSGSQSIQNKAGATSPVTLDGLAQKYGRHAEAMMQTYRIGGGKQDVQAFDRAFEMAYEFGKNEASREYVMKTPALADLTDQQRELAYEVGLAAAEQSSGVRMAETNEPVTIGSVVAVENGALRVELEDGRVVDAASLDFGDAGQALIYETVAGIGVDAEGANTLIGNYAPGKGLSAAGYAAQIQTAYRLGQYLPEAQLKKAKGISGLTAKQRADAIRLGKQASIVTEKGTKRKGSFDRSNRRIIWQQISM